MEDKSAPAMIMVHSPTSEVNTKDNLSIVKTKIGKPNCFTRLYFKKPSELLYYDPNSTVYVYNIRTRFGTNEYEYLILRSLTDRPKWETKSEVGADAVNYYKSNSRNLYLNGDWRYPTDNKIREKVLGKLVCPRFNFKCWQFGFMDTITLITILIILLNICAVIIYNFY